MGKIMKETGKMKLDEGDFESNLTMVQQYGFNEYSAICFICITCLSLANNCNVGSGWRGFFIKLTKTVYIYGV